MRRAVIDVGSNSVLLTIAEQDPAGWKVVEERTFVTSLGEGTKQTGVLAESNQVATLGALQQCWEISRRLGATDIGAAATMAARIASNADEFLARANDQGTPVAVLTGDEEAALGYEAVIRDPSFKNLGAVAIADIGGQSTEVVIGEARDGMPPTYLKSFDVGTLALREGILRDDAPPASARFQAAVKLDQLFGPICKRAPDCLVVLGATGTNLISMRDQLESWQPQKVHAGTLSMEDVSSLCSRLCELGDRGRLNTIGIESGREKTIHIGALILERIMNALHVEACRVSIQGWRHALIEDSARFAPVAP